MTTEVEHFADRYSGDRAVDVENILKIIGPAASIIFAAWIFMGFLQSRFDAAYDRYIGVIGEYRDADTLGRRRGYLKDKVKTYRLRCTLMNIASSVGLISAVCLISAVIAGALVPLVPSLSSPLAYACIGGALTGFVLIIVAAAFVFVEGLIIHRQLGRHSWDVSDFD